MWTCDVSQACILACVLSAQAATQPSSRERLFEGSRIFRMHQQPHISLRRRMPRRLADGTSAEAILSLEGEQLTTRLRLHSLYWSSFKRSVGSGMIAGNIGVYATSNAVPLQLSVQPKPSNSSSSRITGEQFPSDDLLRIWLLNRVRTRTNDSCCRTNQRSTTRYSEAQIRKCRTIHSNLRPRARLGIDAVYSGLDELLRLGVSHPNNFEP